MDYFKTPQELIDSVLCQNRNPMFEIDGDDVYIGYKGNKLIAGGVTNVGIIPEYTMDYDPDISGSENLQSLYDLITDA